MTLVACVCAVKIVVSIVLIFIKLVNQPLWSVGRAHIIGYEEIYHLLVAVQSVMLCVVMNPAWQIINVLGVVGQYMRNV